MKKQLNDPAIKFELISTIKMLIHYSNVNIKVYRYEGCLSLGCCIKVLYYSRGTCTPMFIEALFTIAKLWKQPRCPTTDKWIKKMWYLYTMEFYAAMEKNEMLSFAGKWMELENIILSEVSLAQKTKNRMFSLICGH
jgi:hypothetical protein